MDAPTSSYQSSYEQVTASTLYFRPVLPEDLAHVYALETASYPPDEAATLEKLQLRIQEAPDFFLVACTVGPTQEESVCGYVCGTCTASSTLTHETMSRHDPEGGLLCVHSVCVEEGRRRQGMASRMLRAYLQMVGATSPHVHAVHLICKEGMVRGSGWGPSATH